MDQSVSMKNTRQRAAIMEALQKAGGPMSPEQIYHIARKKIPRLGMATIYRNLRLLANRGRIRKVELPGVGTYFELARAPHHHHFLCRQCGAVYDLSACRRSLQQWAPRGFVVEDHEVTLFGLCAGCAVRTTRARSRSPVQKRSPGKARASK